MIYLLNKKLFYNEKYKGMKKNEILVSKYCLDFWNYLCCVLFVLFLLKNWHLVGFEFLEEFCSEFVGKITGLDKDLEEVLGLYLEKREEVV